MPCTLLITAGEQASLSCSLEGAAKPGVTGCAPGVPQIEAAPARQHTPRQLASGLSSFASGTRKGPTKRAQDAYEGMQRLPKCKCYRIASLLTTPSDLDTQMH